MAQPLALANEQPSTSIKASLDKTTGSAGDVLTLTIERIAPADDSGDVVFLYSETSSVAWSDTIYVGP